VLGEQPRVADENLAILDGDDPIMAGHRIGALRGWQAGPTVPDARTIVLAAQVLPRLVRVGGQAEQADPYRRPRPAFKPRSDRSSQSLGWPATPAPTGPDAAEAGTLSSA
jgi:hypothetical protein